MSAVFHDFMRTITTADLASVTPTTGGRILTGDTKGNFIAFDAKNGKVLLDKNLGARSAAPLWSMESLVCRTSRSGALDIQVNTPKGPSANT